MSCSYIRLWNSDTSINFVQKTKLMAFFHCEYHGFVQLFFQTDTVSYEDYFLFVCFFMFFDNSHIIPLLMSMCKIYSNICVTYDQIKDFMVHFFLREEDYEDLEDVLEQCRMDLPDYSVDTYPIKTFTQYIKNSQAFNKLILEFKNYLINYTLTPQSYELISNRIDFYYKNTNNFGNNISFLHPPQEPFCEKMKRKTFTNLPAPYHFDFGLQYPNSESKDHVLLSLKQKFGYSVRKKSEHPSLSPGSPIVHSRSSALPTLNSRASTKDAIRTTSAIQLIGVPMEHSISRKSTQYSRVLCVSQSKNRVVPVNAELS